MGHETLTRSSKNGSSLSPSAQLVGLKLALGPGKRWAFLDQHCGAPARGWLDWLLCVLLRVCPTDQNQNEAEKDWNL